MWAVGTVGSLRVSLDRHMALRRALWVALPWHVPLRGALSRHVTLRRALRVALWVALPGHMALRRPLLVALWVALAGHMALRGALHVAPHTMLALRTALVALLLYLALRTHGTGAHPRHPAHWHPHRTVGAHGHLGEEK